MRKILSKILFKISQEIYREKGIVSWSEIQKKRTFSWNEIHGNETLRLDYDLNENSLVFDLGGYEGQWASDLFSKYRCSIYIFEPVEEFFDKIRKRFLENTKISVYKFGLGKEAQYIKILMDGSASSVFRYAKLYDKDEKTATIEIVKASDFFREKNTRQIDLMKINIEGGEYDLLDHLIESGFVKNIKNIQVQFHDFVPRAMERMKKIQRELQKTHHLTYQYLFVFENWKLNT